MIKVQLVSPVADPAALPGADADIPCDRSSEAAADAALCLELKICAFPGLGERCDSVVTRFVESQECSGIWDGPGRATGGMLSFGRRNVEKLREPVREVI